MEKKKQTKGRQKIEMKKIENEEDRLITFSKRRSGIYKKASELSTLCGAEVGIIIFSPAGKPFSFATPSIGSVANRFLNPPQDGNQPNDQNSIMTHPLVEAHRRVRITDLNHHYNDIVTQLEVEKERGIELDMRKKARANEKEWWEARAEDLGLDELKRRNELFEELYQNLGYELMERGVFGGSSSSSYVPGNYDTDQRLADPTNTGPANDYIPHPATGFP